MSKLYSKEWVQKQLEKLDFVEWDRFYIYNQTRAVFYGWIEREKDQYKDFVTLEVDTAHRKVLQYNTSSSEYTEEIAEILGFEHAQCQRVENHLPQLSNKIELQKEVENRE